MSNEKNWIVIFWKQEEDAQAFRPLKDEIYALQLSFY